MLFTPYLKSPRYSKGSTRHLSAARKLDKSPYDQETQVFTKSKRTSTREFN